MGCSPSKGKLFSKPEDTDLQNTMVAETSSDTAHCKPVQMETKKLKAEENTPSIPTEESRVTETASNTTDTQNKEDIQENGQWTTTVDNAVPHDVVSNIVQTDNIKKKQKKNNGNRRSTEKQRKSSVVQTKMDFLPHVVRAHQAAYTFLNPNISKYETLLGLLDQVAQIQLSLQPMMSTLLLHFEEINQALEEMAEEGELMLKEHWDYMTLPSGMMGPTLMSAKLSTDINYPSDPPPDLLQQLLQHSVEKMKQVGGSVQSMGDTTLDETVKYFFSLSKLLVKKMEVKQAAEQRLSQVLSQVERAAMRKSNPEDSTLHSEDSGIGGENESLTGSEKHRRHRGSVGSESCGSGVNMRGVFDSLPSNLRHLVGHNKDNEEEEDYEDDEDDEEYDENYSPGRKRSYSSPPDPCQALCSSHANDIHSQQSTVKRPLTAPKPERSSFSSCVNVMAELQKSQRDLNQRMKKMSEMKELAGPHYVFYRAGLRRHSFNGSAGVQKGPLKTNQAPCFFSVLAPKPPGRHTVRRLINTFSQGVDGRPGQNLDNIPPHIRRARRSGVLASNVITCSEEGLNYGNNSNSWPDSRDVLDIDSLPPPPPEVLMDNSFQSTEGRRENDDQSQKYFPVVKQKTGTFRRPKISTQNVEVLPNRTSMRPQLNIFGQPAGQDVVVGAQNAEQQPDTQLDSEMKKNSCVYQQAHKIIHLNNLTESADKRNVGPSRISAPLQAKISQRCQGNEFSEGKLSPCSLPVIAPPVSRVRLLPSCPSVHHQFSNTVLRPQSTSSPSSSSSPAKKATDNTKEIIPSVSFQDARLVFCRNELQNTSGSVLLSRWGDASRSRTPTRRMENSSRRTQSERRPSGISHSEFIKDGNVASTQAKKDEPVYTQYRPGSPLMSSDAAHSNAVMRA